MRYVKIKISELKPDSKQPRKLLEGLKELGESIKAKGQLQPISITSKNEILDGHRRYFASKKIGLEYLDAVILDDKKKLTPFLRKAFPFAINVERGEFKPWDMAESICDIYWNYFLEDFEPTSKNDCGYSEFAKYMGISATTIRDIIKTYEIAKKSKPLNKAIQEKELSPSILKEVARLPKEKHFNYINLAKEEKEKAKEATSSIYTVLGKVKDRIKDEKYKEKLNEKQELSNAYINRFVNKIRAVLNLINQTVLDIASDRQKKEMKKAIQPLIEFYNKIDV